MAQDIDRKIWKMCELHNLTKRQRFSLTIWDWGINALASNSGYLTATMLWMWNSGKIYNSFKGFTSLRSYG